MYLHHFEKIVRATVVGLGGPEDWALPYWDYSDPARPQTRMLPPAFRAETTPESDPNPLFVQQRGHPMNVDGTLDPENVAFDLTFSEEVFTDRGQDSISGFGGPATGRNPGGGPVGSLEVSPRGGVHVGVGGVRPRGWMSRFETAGRDPIFWLHHANIDRLWEAWPRMGGTRRNPRDRRWRGQSFTFGGGAVHTTLSVQDVLDPTAAPLRYRYSDMPVPAVPAAGGVRGTVRPWPRSRRTKRWRRSRPAPLPVFPHPWRRRWQAPAQRRVLRPDHAPRTPRASGRS